MSWLKAEDPKCETIEEKRSPIETVIVPRARDLGDFEVRRALPSSKKQMIGPFIFFDQMGPAEFLLGRGMDVRPHPHIGLATVTYLFRGEITHKDSLGTDLPIRPGEVNWMTAGKGIAHSERTPPDHRDGREELFGIQAWVALPRHDEERDPDFSHHEKAALPLISGEGKDVRLIAGSLYGESSPVPTFSDMFYADCALEPGAALPLEAGHEERGLYLVNGALEIAGTRFEAGQLLVFHPGDKATLRAVTPARFMLLGGEPMDGPRYIWWNFVASTEGQDRAGQSGLEGRPLPAGAE